MRTTVLVAFLFALVACKAKLTTGDCTKDTDCKDDRVCESGTCVAGAKGPARRGSGFEDNDDVGEDPGVPPVAQRPTAIAPPSEPRPGAEPVADPAPVAAQNAGGTEGGGDCEAAVSNDLAIAKASGNAALVKIAAEISVASATARCQSERWPAAVTRCLIEARTVDKVFHECYLLPFKDVALTQNRRFSINNLAGIQNAQPKLFEQSGDYVEVRANCGFHSQHSGPFRALFLICDGKTRALMTPDENTEAFAAFAADESNRHKIVTSITARTRVDVFGGWKVCDRAGNCRIQ